MASRNGKLEKMNMVFPQALKKMKIGNEFYGHMVLQYWPKIVGKSIAANVFPVKLEFKKLFLNASHPAWANQLTYMKRDLIEKINSYMGEFLVEEIIFTQMKADILKVDDEESGKDNDAESITVELEEKDLEEAREAVKEIKDDDIRAAMLRVYENDKRLKKYRISKGWIECPKCGTLIGQQEGLCSDCKRIEEKKRLESIRQYLVDIPWSRYCDIAKDIECTAYEVNEQRIQLMQKLASMISMKNLDCIELRILTMLYKNVSPDKINQELIDSTVKRFKYDFNDSFAEKNKQGIIKKQDGLKSNTGG